MLVVGLLSPAEADTRRLETRDSVSRLQLQYSQGAARRFSTSGRTCLDRGSVSIVSARKSRQNNGGGKLRLTGKLATQLEQLSELWRSAYWYLGTFPALLSVAPQVQDPAGH